MAFLSDPLLVILLALVGFFAFLILHSQRQPRKSQSPERSDLVQRTGSRIDFHGNFGIVRNVKRAGNRVVYALDLIAG